MADPQPTFCTAVKYVIVDRFGDILWMGRATTYAAMPLPEDDEDKRALFLVQTALTIRDATPDSAPLGRVVILAASRTEG